MQTLNNAFFSGVLKFMQSTWKIIEELCGANINVSRQRVNQERTTSTHSEGKENSPHRRQYPDKYFIEKKCLSLCMEFYLYFSIFCSILSYISLPGYIPYFLIFHFVKLIWKTNISKAIWWVFYLITISSCKIYKF